jgi:hypothetical protein
MDQGSATPEQTAMRHSVSALSTATPYAHVRAFAKERTKLSKSVPLFSTGSNIAYEVKVIGACFRVSPRGFSGFLG